MDGIPFDIVAFDLDGTLVDSSGDLAAAVNFALAEAGRPPVVPADVLPMIGGGAKNLLMKALERSGGLPEDGFKPYYKALLGYYGQNVAVHTRPYPGAIAALDDLAAAGVKLALITNKFESFARDLLTQLDLIDRFEVFIGGDTLGKGRAKPAPDQLIAMRERLGGGPAVYIGDSFYDVDAARAAQMPVLLAGWGFHSGDPAELGADAVLDGYADLIPALRAL